MSELLSSLPLINPSILSKLETVFLEADIYVRICKKLKEMIKNQYQVYFSIMNFSEETEEAMLESQFARNIINDILATEEYTIPGIAYYTHKPEDVIFEIVSGKNTDPSSLLLRKIIELHRSVRPALYEQIMKKIISEAMN